MVNDHQPAVTVGKAPIDAGKEHNTVICRPDVDRVAVVAC